MANIATTPDAYVSGLPPESQMAANAIRGAIHDAVPDTHEAVKYGILAFQRAERTFVYAGVWKKHIGLYPIYRGDSDFETAVGPYRAKADAVQFPLKKPLPLDLIARIARVQATRFDD